jgi:hypothetical protein
MLKVSRWLGKVDIPSMVGIIDVLEGYNRASDLLQQVQLL